MHFYGVKCSFGCLTQYNYYTMKYFKLTLVLFGVIAFQGCDDEFSNDDCLDATGAVMEEELNLDPFDQISLEIPADVFVRRGDEQQVTIEAQAAVIDQLVQTSVQSGLWDIEFDRCINTDDGINIFITIPNLEQVNISGSGDVVIEDTFQEMDVTLITSGSGSIEGGFEANNIDSSISGSGSISLLGTAQTSVIRISGSGSVDAFELQTETCEVSISGSGSASVFVNDFLDVNIAGSGNVRYRGNPIIELSISGSGSLIDSN